MFEAIGSRMEGLSKAKTESKLGLRSFGDFKVQSRSDEVETGVATKSRRTREISGEDLTTSPSHINLTTSNSPNANLHSIVQGINGKHTNTDACRLHVIVLQFGTGLQSEPLPSCTSCIPWNYTNASDCMLLVLSKTLVADRLWPMP